MLLIFVTVTVISTFTTSSLSSSVASAVRSVVADNSTTSSILVMEGDSVRLTCKTSMQWFFCMWNSPQREQSCAIQLGQPTSVCAASNKSVLIGSKHSCDLQLQVSQVDHGQWMCLINDNLEFNSVKQFLNLNVGVLPATGVSIEAGESFDADTETVVEVIEGDSIALSCYARRGYPPASVYWDYDISNSTSLAVQPAEYQQDTQSHLVTVIRTIIYTANIMDHNSSISCRITQTHLQSDSLLYARNMRVSLAVKEKRFPAPLVRRITALSGIVVICAISLLGCLVLLLIIVKISRKKRRRSSLHEIPLVYRTPMVSQQYSNGDVFTQISDHTKPLTHTCSTNFLDGREDGTEKKNKHLEPLLIQDSGSYRSPSINRHSRSSSDCASLYSHEEATLIDKLHSREEVTLHDNPFNPSLGSHGDILHSTDTGLSVCTSVPHLYRRRSSIPARILINPTSYPAKSLTNLTACKSHHDHPHRIHGSGEVYQGPKSKRRRRKTAPAQYKSTHSVFDCEQGCFDVEHDISKSQQFVFITTGPMII